MHIGFSTGSLALGDYKGALNMLHGSSANVVELSALREKELIPLIEAIRELDLHQYKYVSFHAPSKLVNYSEAELIFHLKKVLEYRLPIILHPDLIQDIRPWRIFGKYLCIENMDKRKPIGRTASDLEELFYYLPEASFCFDLAHVRQVDTTMSEGFEIINRFRGKLSQLHVSDVNSNSAHEPLNLQAVLAFRKIAPFIDHEIPIILESPVDQSQIEAEIAKARIIFDDVYFDEYINTIGIYFDGQSGILRNYTRAS